MKKLWIPILLAVACAGMMVWNAATAVTRPLDLAGVMVEHVSPAAQDIPGPGNDGTANDDGGEARPASAPTVSPAPSASPAPSDLPATPAPSEPPSAPETVAPQPSSPPPAPAAPVQPAPVQPAPAPPAPVQPAPAQPAGPAQPAPLQQAPVLPQRVAPQLAIPVLPVPSQTIEQFDDKGGLRDRPDKIQDSDFDDLSDFDG